MVITVFMLTIKKFGNPYLNFLFEFWRSDALCFRFTAQRPMLTVNPLHILKISSELYECLLYKRNSINSPTYDMH